MTKFTCPKCDTRFTTPDNDVKEKICLNCGTDMIKYVKTNRARINAMTNKELVRWKLINTCYCCVHSGVPCWSKSCIDGIAAWLDQPAEGE